MEKNSQPFVSAQWIWPESHFWDIHNSYALFRKRCLLAEVPAHAPLFITADQSYQLHVNGEYVCRGPARGFQAHWPYDEVDVARWLRPGSNVIAVRAHNPGFSNFQYVTQGYAGLLVEARWGDMHITTDATWKCRRQNGTNRDTVPTSLQLFCQEHIDLREEDPLWMQAGHDDSGWNAEVALRPWNSMPWHTLEERGIPLLEETRWARPPVVIGQSEGRSAAGWQHTRDAARLRHSEGLRHGPCQFDADEIEAAPTAPADFRSFLLDFGLPVVGSVGFEIEGARGGEVIDTLHVETIDMTTLTPDYVPGKGCCAAFAHRLTCRPGAQTHFFYHAFGFRYMLATVRGATAGLRLRPQMRTAFYPLEARGSFRCPDDALQGIWNICVWTQRICSLDAFVDTPWREQAQWWGDARVQAKNTFFLSGDTRLFRRGIAQIASQHTPDGLTYGHAPTMAHNCILPDFSLIWLLTLWDDYWQTGSTESFDARQDSIEKILGYFQTAMDPDKGLVRYDPRYWLFLDWTRLHRTGIPSVLNLWLILALDRTAQLYTLTGRQAQATKLGHWRQALAAALHVMVDGKGFLRDGYDEQGEVVEEASIHTQVLALMAGITDVAEARVLDETLLPFVRGERGFEAEPSSYWITYVFEWMREAGHGREVIDCIRRRWSPMIAQGGTWENFEPMRGNESFSHAWSAHPLYHLMQIAGGVVQAAPAWRRVRFEPCFCVAACETIVPSPAGPIRSEWHREAAGIAVRLELPPGVEADIALPGIAPGVATGNRSWKLLGTP